jgi:hypothetical protein
MQGEFSKSKTKLLYYLNSILIVLSQKIQPYLMTVFKLMMKKQGLLTIIDDAY